MPAVCCSCFQPCELKVDSDLLNVNGPATVLVPARNKSGGGGEATYELWVNAQMGGTVQVRLFIYIYICISIYVYIYIFI